MFERWLMAICIALAFSSPVRAHEGHDHDKPPPLTLPVAPRVVAVTPELELVGIMSGKERLTVFLHAFATNEPVKGARLVVAAGDNRMDAQPQGDGVFAVAAPWIAGTQSLDLVFELTLADGTQDLLAGVLQRTPSVPPDASAAPTLQIGKLELSNAHVAAAVGGLLAGILLTLLAAGATNRRRPGSTTRKPLEPIENRSIATMKASGRAEPDATGEIKPLRRGTAALAVALVGLSCTWLPSRGQAAEPPAAALPSVPSTMATDLAQRMPDGTLFVPKATQHLLSMRTMLTGKGTARRTLELAGTIIPGPQHFGRVQPGRPGRIEAPEGGLAFVGMRVEKGQTLAFVQSYIEAADKANMDSAIAETEARIAKNRTILSRYEARPGAVPQVKIDEVRGELDALVRKRAELVPTRASREPVLAPVSGVVSLANATIGQIVDARDILFEIVDPSQFWVEAHGYSHGSDVDFAGINSTAFAIVDGGVQLPLQFAGQGLALRHQAIVLTFRVPGQHSGLAVGKPVKVMIQTSEDVEGFVVPSSAVVRGQTGLSIVWLKSEAERFEPQTVDVLPIDGKSVLIKAGLKEDQRVVTDGVTLLNQVR